MSIPATAHRSSIRHSFPAMGSVIELAVAGGDTHAAAATWHMAESLAEEWEQTFSRFRPDSELSRLNREAGSAVVVSSRLYDAVGAAIAGSRASGGLFDPTILPALIAQGYDRDFAEITDTGRSESAPRAVPGINHIALDPKAQTIKLPVGVALDLGGIAKGLFADELAAQMADYPGGCVSAGGDLRVWGDGPSGDGWLVGIEHPNDITQEIARIRIHDRGVATSGINRRSWKTGGAVAHHLIDPRTGRSGGQTVSSVTVVGQTAGLAEVAATALFLAGGDAAALRGFGGVVGPAFVVARNGAHWVIDQGEV